MIDPELEVYAGLSIAVALRAAPALAGTLLQTGGVRSVVPETVKEWLALDVLSLPRRKSRVGTWWGAVLFQVSCFSRGGTDRADGSSVGAQVLASKVARALEQSRVLVQTHGVSPLSTLATLSMGVPQMMRIPPLPKNDVWCFAVTFTASLIAN